ncbi:MAG: lipocalin family protein [Thermodesulfobacteriota bacterium]
MECIVRFSRIVAGVLLCCTVLVCSSCFSTVAPKTAREERTPRRPVGPIDKNLVSTWELIYQVNEKGERKLPDESWRTRLEFTDKGDVIFNKSDTQGSLPVQTKTGTYSLEKSEMTITDDLGNTVTWPYTVADDVLVITMPEGNKKFYWRRIAPGPGTAKESK